MSMQIFKQKKAFIAYLTAGAPDCDYTVAAAVALVEAGVDVLEIGVPFSDPIADGEVISAAMNTAVANGVSLRDVFTVISKIKAKVNVPIVLFSYLNPLLNMVDSMVQAKKSGVDAALVVDLPLEEADGFIKSCNDNHINPVMLAAPTTTIDRIEKFNNSSSAFIYYVCRNGTTGVKQQLPLGFAEKMATIKQHTSLPVAAGFGIANNETAAQVLQVADGFVVGSLFVDAINKGASINDLQRLARNIDPR